jgi:hypothetical protein
MKKRKDNEEETRAYRFIRFGIQHVCFAFADFKGWGRLSGPSGG